MIHVCEYLEPFDTINMSSTCKKLYLKMDEHLSNTKSSKDFKILKKNEDCIKDEKYILGIGQPTLFLNKCNLKNVEKKIKNVEIVLSSILVIENSLVHFEDCIFYPERNSSMIDIRETSDVTFSFCYIRNFSMFCKSYDSTTDFENTIFENVSVPIIGRRIHSKIFDTKFINCTMPINYFERFRLVVRNTHFLEKCVNSMIIHSRKDNNHLEIGDCYFGSCRRPLISMTRENEIDIY